MQSLRHIIAYSLPFVLVFIFLGWYSYWEVSLSQALKISGLVGIFLFSITFLVGPLAKFWHAVDELKVFRKYWGIVATLLITAHMILAFSTVYKSSLSSMFSLNFTGPRYLFRYGFWLGFLSFLYFVFMAAISNNPSMAKLGHRWKALQTAGYLALASAWVHFVFLETKPDVGHFLIKKPLGRFTFALVTVALLVRLYVWIWTRSTTAKQEPQVPVVATVDAKSTSVDTISK